jgi:hypothetical protein
MTTSTARRLWTLYEPYHAVVYFAPQVEAALKDAPIRAVGNELGAAVSGSPRLALWQATTTLRGTAGTATSLRSPRPASMAAAPRCSQWRPARTASGCNRDALGTAGTERLAELLAPIAAHIAGAIVPYPNPIAVPRPSWSIARGMGR